MELAGDPSTLEASGIRLAGGAHTSRTIMLAEVGTLLQAVPDFGARRAEYTNAVVEQNVLGKKTAANRRLTNTRLGELYGLDAGIPVFRGFRRAWEADPEGRPVAALLICLARDPFLRATADLVLGLAEGDELVRGVLVAILLRHSEGRLNEANLDKVARNVASSWAQSGHLEGRTRKHRRLVAPSPGPVALALWLGSLEGRAGEGLLASAWCAVFDGPKSRVLEAALRAKQLGLVSGTVGVGAMHLDASPLLSGAAGSYPGGRLAQRGVEQGG